MKTSLSSLVALTVAYTFAAALFGFGSDMFVFRSYYAGLDRGTLILTMRSIVYLILGVLLAFRGGWRGVFAAIIMALCATTAERLLFPIAYGLAAINDPSGYAKKFGNVIEPSWNAWGTVFDVALVGISAALAQGLRIMSHSDPDNPLG